MTNFEKAIAAAWLIFGIFIATILIAYWWFNTVPRRPKSVSGNAAFLWAPRVALPVSRRGWWLSCWVANSKNRCKKSNIDGTTNFEGDFIPYRRTSAVPAEQLTIIGDKTEDAKKFWIGNALVPLIYLTNGDILIPADAYEQGEHFLDKKQEQGQ